MDDSILLSIKLNIGIDAEDTAFDFQLINYINSVFVILNQLGVGPAIPYSIKNESNEWSEFIDTPFLESVKTYVYAKTKKMFDPPSNSIIMEALNSVINEFECRFTYTIETGEAYE